MIRTTRVPPPQPANVEPTPSIETLTPAVLSERVVQWRAKNRYKLPREGNPLRGPVIATLLESNAAVVQNLCVALTSLRKRGVLLGRLSPANQLWIRHHDEQGECEKVATALAYGWDTLYEVRDGSDYLNTHKVFASSSRAGRNAFVELSLGLEFVELSPPTRIDYSGFPGRKEFRLLIEGLLDLSSAEAFAIYQGVHDRVSAQLAPMVTCPTAPAISAAMNRRNQSGKPPL